MMRKLSKLSIGIGFVLIICGGIWISYHLRRTIEEKSKLKKPEIGAEQTKKGEIPQGISRWQPRPSTSKTVEPEASSGTVEMKGETSEKKSKTSETLQMKSETDEEIGKAEKIEAIGEAEEKADKGAKELSPELQRKVEVYTELASILPEYKRLVPLVLNIPSGDKNRTDSERALIAHWGEIGKRILDLCEPFIGPPAIKRDERGVIQELNLAPLFTQVAKYMGKELPFDENPDYFSAKDYQGGTGGW